MQSLTMFILDINFVERCVTAAWEFMGKHFIQPGDVISLNKVVGPKL